jgi:hypothetical protein
MTYGKLITKLNPSFVAFLLLSLITLVGFLSVRTVFIGGEIPGWDHGFHYTNAYLTYKYFIPSGNLLGYDSWHMFGWPPNLYYNPGTTFFVAFLYLILSKFLDFSSTYNLGVILSYVLLAPASYLFVYSISKSKLAGLLSALSAITIFNQEDSWFDVGWRQVYYIGMWPERMGLVAGMFGLAFFTLAINSEEKLIKRSVYLSLSVLFTGWAVLSHVMMGVSALIAMVFILLFKIISVFASQSKPKLIVRLLGDYTFTTLVAIALTFSLISFWFIPLLQTNDTFHGLPTLTWEVGPSMVQNILNSYPQYFNIFLFIGPLVSVLRNKRKSLLTWSLLALFFVAIVVSMFGASLLNESLFSSVYVYSIILDLLLFFVMPNEFETFMPLGLSILLLWLSTGPRTYYVNVLGLGVNLYYFPFFKYLGFSKFGGFARYVLLAYFSIIIAKLFFLVFTYVREKQIQSKSVSYTILTIILLFLIIAYIEPVFAGITQNTDLLSTESSRKFKFIEDFPLQNNITKLLDYLKSQNIVSNNTYILMQDPSNNFADWVNYCNTHFIYQTSLILNKPMIGGIVWTRYVTQPISTSEYSKFFTLPMSYLSTHVDEFYYQLKELGITYVMTFDKDLIRSLRSDERFKELYSDGTFSIFKTIDFNPIVEVNSTTAEVSNVTIMPNYLKFTLNGNINTTYEIKIKLVNFPSWAVASHPQAYSLSLSSYSPHILFEVSQTWGLPVEKLIPFMLVRVKPSSNSTTFTLIYKASSTGDAITKATMVGISLIFITGLIYFFFNVLTRRLST